MQNDNDFIKNLNLVYDSKNVINRETLNKYVINNVSFKIKAACTKDNKTIIVSDNMINDMKEKNMTFEKCTYDELANKYYSSNDYILLKDLLRDAKGSIVTYIELLNTSKKHQMENEMIDEIKSFGVKAMVSSSHTDIINYFKKKAPTIVRGIKFLSLEDEDLKLGFFEKNKIKNVKYSKGIKPSFVEYDIRSLPNAKVDKLRKNNVAIVAELIDTDAKASKAMVYANAQVIKKDILL